MHRAKPRVPILMYHSLSKTGTAPFRRFTVAPELFQAHLGYLADQGYRTLTMSQLVELRARRGPLPAKPVVLTFDDGFADFYTEAMPGLARHGFTATLYVITGYVGGTSLWLAAEGEGDRRILSWRQLGEIADSGVECAAHSHTHPQLDTLDTRRVREELSLPKRVLEDRLQRPVRSFAYPFGYYSARVRALVSEAGYSSACTVKDLISSAEEAFVLPRLTVNAGTTVEGFAALLDQDGPSVASRCVAEAKRAVWQGIRRYGPTSVVCTSASGVPTRMAGSQP